MRCESETATGQEKESQLLGHWEQRGEEITLLHLGSLGRCWRSQLWAARSLSAELYCWALLLSFSEMVTSAPPQNGNFFPQHNGFSAFWAVYFHLSASFPSGSPGGLAGDSPGSVFYARSLVLTQEFGLSLEFGFITGVWFLCQEFVLIPGVWFIPGVWVLSHEFGFIPGVWFIPEFCSVPGVWFHPRVWFHPTKRSSPVTQGDLHSPSLSWGSWCLFCFSSANTEHHIKP